MESPGEAIENVLMQIGAAVRLNRIWMIDWVNDGKDSLVHGYQWTAEGVPQVEPSFCVQFPATHPAIKVWLAALSRREHVVAIAGIATQAVSEVLNELQLRSLLLMPIFDGPRLSAYLGFGSADVLDTWDESELDTLRLLAQLIGASLRGPSERNNVRPEHHGFWCRSFLALGLTRSDQRKPARAELEKARP